MCRRKKRQVEKVLVAKRQRKDKRINGLGDKSRVKEICVRMALHVGRWQSGELYVIERPIENLSVCKRLLVLQCTTCIDCS